MSVIRKKAPYYEERELERLRAELAESEQIVRGVVIALDDDQRLRRALAMVPAIEFYRYEVNFKLVKMS